MKLDLSVCSLTDGGKLTCLYEYIESWEEADKLAQYAMNHKKSVLDLIVIVPGWNRGLEDTDDLIALAKQHEPSIFGEQQKIIDNSKNTI